MRCEASVCMWNDDGYCSRVDYVTIDRNGECSEYYPRASIDLGLKTKTTDKKECKTDDSENAY